MEILKKIKKHPLLPILAGIMIFIPLIFTAGCTGDSPVYSEHPLNGTGWTLTHYVRNGTFIQALNSTTVTLDLSEDGRMTGSAGCNHYFAAYETKGSAITVGPAGSTLMYCPAAGVMEQESAYLSLLNQARSLTIEDDRLSLADAQGTTILSFITTIPPVPEPLIGTNWTLESFQTTDAVSSIVAGTTITAVFSADGRVGGSAGCNRYFASFNVTGTTVSIGTVGSTKMYCSNPGVMQQEATYLTSLSRVTAFTINGERLSLADTGGTTLLSFTKGP